MSTAKIRIFDGHHAGEELELPAPPPPDVQMGKKAPPGTFAEPTFGHEIISILYHRSHQSERDGAWLYTSRKPT